MCPSRPQPRLIFAWSAALLCAVPLSAANAAGFNSVFDLDTSAEYNSNPALVPDAIAEPVWLGIATPQFTTYRSVDGHSLELEAALRLQRSSDEDLSRNREDPKVGLTWNRAGERSNLLASALYEESSTRLTELEDTNLVLLDGTRSDLSANLEWTYQLSRRQEFEATATLTDATFENSPLVDFESLTGSLGYSVRATESLRPFVNLTAVRFVPDEEGAAGRPVAESEMVGLGLGLSVQLNSFWTVEATGSAVRLDSNPSADAAVPFDPDTAAPVDAGATALDGDAWNAEARVEYRGARTRFSASGGRTTAPSAAGAPVEADVANIMLSRDTSAVSQVGLSVQWRRNSGAVENEISGGELYYERRLSETWTVRSAWAYRERQQLADAVFDNPLFGDASAHVITLSLEYRGPRP